jgi:hypothetical protein
MRRCVTLSVCEPNKFIDLLIWFMRAFAVPTASPASIAFLAPAASAPSASVAGSAAFFIAN